MRRRPVCVVFALGLLLMMTESGPASSGRGDKMDSVACTISAWSTDTDPKGLKVRAGPGPDAPVVARLPPPIKVEDYAFAAEVSITGSKDGWFRINKAILDNYVGEQEPKVVFEGEGWVSGRLLGLTVNATNLRRGPSRNTPVIARLSSAKGEGPDSFAVDRLYACQGDWVEVEGTFVGHRLRGWTRGTCANQVTTCP
jgi:hypothetical protein